jgi:hypothetical protein
VASSRALARRPMSDRWHAEPIQAVSILPWNHRPEEGDAAVQWRDAEGKLEESEDRTATVPRRFKINKIDLDRFGYTSNCEQCDHVLRYGQTRGGMQHNETCRERIRAAMLDAPDSRRRIEDSELRVTRALAERVEAADLRQRDDRRAPEGAEIPALEPRVHDGDGGDFPNDLQVQAPWQDAPQTLEDDIFDSVRASAPSHQAPQPPQNESQGSAADLDGDMQVDGDDEAAVVDSVFLLQDETTALIIDQLAGGGRAYAREKRAAVRKLVCEVFSPPRLTNHLSKFPNQYLAPGFSLDLTCVDPSDGQPWDFDRADKRKRALELVRRIRPKFLVGSPVCTPWSSWQALNNTRRDPSVVQREKVRSMVHLRFMATLYAEQMAHNRYFLHEHPEFATSWETECIQEIMDHPQVQRVRGDQCQYGQQVRYGHRQGSPVLKPTGFMSNGQEILNELGLRCTGHRGECSRRHGGRHEQCAGRVARDSARYPDGLCRAILKGMVKQLKADGVVNEGVVGMQAKDEETTAYNLNECGGMCSGRYRDDLTGQALIDELVVEARRTELEYFTRKGVWVKRPKEEARAMTGKGAISVRWVDVNKGDDISPKYRSRLVARQLKAHDRSGQSYFSPAPPLEALRTVISLAVTEVGGWVPDLEPSSKERTQISTLDISRAYFNAKKDPDVLTYVQLPEEDPDCEKSVGKLVYHMYGTRDAADGWQEEYSTSLVTFGFRQGRSSACVFAHTTRKIVTSVHGDDFTSVGAKTDLDWFEGEMKNFYELTVGPRLGPGANDAKECTVLNRVIRYTDDGVEYEADPRQCEKFVSECGMTGANSVATPGVKELSSQIAEDQPLDEKFHTPYRASAARANYLAADRPDGQFAAKEVCRWMSKPSNCSWAALKRLARFFTGLPRLVYRYAPQKVEAVDVYVDTDWAGCARTRKSTSGGCVMMGRHAIKTWASTQATVSLSSGEAEFNGVLKGSGIGLGYQSLLADLGLTIPLRVWTDSSAAIGVCSRQGLGKLRHIDTHLLWIQQAVRSRRVDLRKIPGEVNPADMFTKHLPSRDRLSALMQLLGCQYRDGRASSAPMTRTAETGKVTISEANIVDDEPMMPHLAHSPEELDKKFPSMRAPDDIGDDNPNDEDTWDTLHKRGLEIIETIRSRTAVHGRRRHEQGSSDVVDEHSSDEKKVLKSTS